MEENRKAKILVVDDNKEICELYKTMLTAHGYEANFVFDGESALELLKHDYYDLILLDIMMPLMDGLNVLVLIKGDPKLAGIKIIMLSAISDPQVIIQAKQYGAYDFIVKGEYTVEDSMEKIEKVLNTKEK